jgi:iron complex transport system permease protein
MTATLGRRLAVSLTAFGLLAVGAIVLAPLVGSTPIALRRVFDPAIPFAENVDAQIFFIARLPRTLAGALVGAMLATAGVVFQGLLRNPLATPFTLGVSAGAALGAMLAITFGWSFAWLGVPAAPAASFIGSIAAVGVVYALARARHQGLSTNVLLLAGVTMNAFFSALILFVQYFADFAETYQILRWLMGDLDVSSYQPILTALPLAIVSLIVFFVAGAAAQPAQPGARRSRNSRLERRRRPARRVLQCVPRDRGGRLGRRPDRLHRYRRSASRPPDYRARSSAGAAGSGALRRRVPDRM